MRSFLLCLTLALTGLTRAEEPKEATAEVQIKITIPQSVASFKGRTLEARLYKYDPLLADKAADLVELHEEKQFSHSQGKETVKEFRLGSKAKLEERRSYYLTLFILDGKTRTHIGECTHAKGFAKVLTQGQPSQVHAVFRELKP
jgi:hypothetical protein